MYKMCLVVLLLTGPVLAEQAGTAGATEGPFLFSYFKDNGQDGLHLAYSHDGLTWTSLKQDRSFLTPEIGSKLMRDPSICQGPDGVFHMVWTTGWEDPGIGIAHSKDLLNWSEQRELPVMGHEPDAVNCWAPEIFYDAPTQTYLIFWSTTIPGRFPETDAVSGDKVRNHRIYYVTTKDFETYTPTELFYDDGFNVIDAFIVRAGGTYVMFLKDETFTPVAKKNIRIATSDKAEGPYSPALPAFSPDWVEGPTALKIGGSWYVYYDAYTRHRYEGVRSNDLETWETITEMLQFPDGARHGTVFPVSPEILNGLLEEK